MKTFKVYVPFPGSNLSAETVVQADGFRREGNWAIFFRNKEMTSPESALQVPVYQEDFRWFCSPCDILLVEE